MRKAMLLYYRYFVFGLIVVGDAVLCSAGVWNLSLAQAAGSTPQVDPFVIFMGAFGLVIVLPTLFLDVFWKHALTGRVWIESVWVGLLSLLHLAGAAAVTANLPAVMCGHQGAHVFANSCTSTKLIEAFAWSCAVSLLVYLFALISSGVIHSRLDDTVWHAHVRTYPWYRHAYCQQIKSRPGSPAPPHRHSVVAPQPRRPINLPTASELGAHYQIEYLGSPIAVEAAENPVPPIPAVTASQSMLQKTRQVSLTMPSLYPEHIQSTWFAPERGPLLPEPSASRPESRPAPWRTASLPADESPLGEWPRKDIMKAPPGPRRTARKPPPSAFPDASQSPPVAEPAEVQRVPSILSPSSRPVRPTGPRQRTRSSLDMPRPPALDLSGISNIRT